MLNPGKYAARAKGAALGLTSTNKEQVAITFEILDGEAAGHTITWFGFFTDLAVDRTLESLRTCGWQGANLADLSGVDANEVEIVVEHDSYNGSVSAKVKWINRAGGGPALRDQLTGNAAAAFAARMRGKVLAFDAKTGARPAATQPRPPVRNAGRLSQPAREEPPPHDDSDLGPPPPGFDDDRPF